MEQIIKIKYSIGTEVFILHHGKVIKGTISFFTIKPCFSNNFSSSPEYRIESNHTVFNSLYDFEIYPTRTACVKAGIDQLMSEEEF